MKQQAKPHYYGHRSRLKARFEENPGSLADYEIVEMMLGYVITRRDVKPVAKDILAKAGSILEIFSIDVADVDGAGHQTEIFFRLLKELYDRLESSAVKARKYVNSAEDVGALFKYNISLSCKEHFGAVFLDSANGVLAHRIMGEGTVNSALIFPRELAEAALKEKAAGVIIVHNHPSGDMTPSPEDMEFTAQIREALNTLGIVLLDHVIVSKNSYFSFKDAGYRI